MDGRPWLKRPTPCRRIVWSVNCGVPRRTNTAGVTPPRPAALDAEKPRTYRRLSRRAKRLIYDVAWSLSRPRTPTELDTFLRQHLLLPIDADEHEPVVPIEAAPVFLKHGGALCRSARPDSVAAGLRLIIDSLHVRASHGDRNALVALVDSATYAADAVRELSTSQPEAVRPVARSCDEWPSTILVHSDWQGENTRMITAIEVGTQSLFAGQMHVKKSPAQGQPFRHIVPVYCERLVNIVDATRAWLDELGMPVLTKSTGSANAARRKRWAGAKRKLQSSSRPWLLKAGELPELEPATASQWFEVGWEGLKALTKRPHELPAKLTEVGAYEQQRQHASSSGRARGDNRSGLKKRHREVFMSVFGR
jgi:hypothetical protein